MGTTRSTDIEAAQTTEENPAENLHWSTKFLKAGVILVSASSFGHFAFYVTNDIHEQNASFETKYGKAAFCFTIISSYSWCTSSYVSKFFFTTGLSSFAAMFVDEGVYRLLGIPTWQVPFVVAGTATVITCAPSIVYGAKKLIDRYSGSFCNFWQRKNDSPETMPVISEISENTALLTPK